MKTTHTIIILTVLLTACGSPDTTQPDTTGSLPMADECAEVCPAGPEGPQGPAGLDGQDGAMGPQGPAGPAGPQGPTGFQGATGSQGPVGPQGQIGMQGMPGIQGPAGPTGPAGGALNSKADLYFASATTQLPPQSTWVSTVAYCDDANDILLHGWCQGPGATNLKFGGEDGINIDNPSAVSGWACIHQNPDTTNPKFVSTKIICIDVP
jgi:Collagen triple helix repeat (20 copies)